MRKILYSSVLMVIFSSLSISLLAQTVPLKPLYEEFTSSTCGPCAGANAILDPLLQANEGTHSLIKYQMNWPGSGDPYYTAEGGVRKVYYGVTGVPSMFINSESLYPGDLTQGIYDSYLTQTTSIELDIVTAEIDEDYVATIELEINPLIDYPAGLTAHIVIVEKVTVGNVASNGETEFFNVMMKMLPDAYGTTLGALTAGNIVTQTESYDMGLTFMEQPNDLAVIVFVQNDSDKEVIQSEQADIEGEFEAYNVTFNVHDSNGGIVIDAEIFLEGNGSAYTDFGGQAVYEGVFSGDYWYTVEKPGLFPSEGDVTVVDSDVTVNVVLEVPDFYFFEDFGEELPTDWTAYATNPDFLYWTSGKVIFFRQSSTNNDILLVSPEIDLSTGETLLFDIGEQNGSPGVSLGTMSNPADPSSFELLESYNPGSAMEQQSFDLTTYEGDNMYLAWRLEGTSFSFFSFDNVIITELLFLAPPSNLDFLYEGTGDIMLSWDAPSTPGVTGFNVYHSLNSGAYSLISENQSELEFTHVEPEIATHSYYITALYDDQESDPSNIVDVVVTSVYDIQPVFCEIYPNPVSNILHIKSDEPLTSVRILDIKGQLLWENENPDTAFTLEMKEFGTGLYLVEFSTANKTFNRNIIVK
jgi:hypothetical protein